MTFVTTVIHMLTGVNIAAFTWGRSDDDDLDLERGNFLNEVTSRIGEALDGFDVDLDSCLAKHICRELNEIIDEGQREVIEDDFAEIYRTAKKVAFKSFIG